MACNRRRGSQKRQQLLGEILERIIEVANPETVILFGSTAKGTAGADSDVDLLVIARVSHRRRTAQAIYERLYGILIPVDIVVATPEDVERHRKRVGSIIGPALRDGKVIYVA